MLTLLSTSLLQGIDWRSCRHNIANSWNILEIFTEINMNCLLHKMIYFGEINVGVRAVYDHTIDRPFSYFCCSH